MPTLGTTPDPGKARGQPRTRPGLPFKRSATSPRRSLGRSSAAPFVVPPSGGLLLIRRIPAKAGTTNTLPPFVVPPPACATRLGAAGRSGGLLLPSFVVPPSGGLRPHPIPAEAGTTPAEAGTTNAPLREARSPALPRANGPTPLVPCRAEDPRLPIGRKAGAAWRDGSPDRASGSPARSSCGAPSGSDWRC